ncbi:hypothetical protein AXF42_Ash001995 [Apostasia shenzhenica]|uniref:Uncharacterized protein n=1 Tax=Apostasia shenzhenica TaxID=1088818 RepID=A0A2I0ABT3_9ASPA|nr:hypothetical protein AXF42_Ash001995 [Apostasia shenzhenica]
MVKMKAMIGAETPGDGEGEPDTGGSGGPDARDDSSGPNAVSEDRAGGTNVENERSRSLPFEYFD